MFDVSSEFKTVSKAVSEVALVVASEFASRFASEVASGFASEYASGAGKYVPFVLALKQ